MLLDWKGFIPSLAFAISVDCHAMQMFRSSTRWDAPFQIAPRTAMSITRIAWRNTSRVSSWKSDPSPPYCLHPSALTTSKDCIPQRPCTSLCLNFHNLTFPTSPAIRNRKTGFKCPRGTGKGTRYPDPCPGRVRKPLPRPALAQPGRVPAPFSHQIQSLRRSTSHIPSYPEATQVRSAERCQPITRTQLPLLVLCGSGPVSFCAVISWGRVKHMRSLWQESHSCSSSKSLLQHLVSGQQHGRWALISEYVCAPGLGRVSVLCQLFLGMASALHVDQVHSAFTPLD